MRLPARFDRHRKVEASWAPPAPYPRHVPGRPWFGLYCGDDRFGGTWCGPEGSLLVLGPPRSGKTTSIVVPCVLDAPAAVVSTSTKPDVMAQSVFWRWMKGRVFLFDPSGETEVPEGVEPAWVSRRLFRFDLPTDMVGDEHRSCGVPGRAGWCGSQGRWRWFADRWSFWSSTNVCSSPARRRNFRRMGRRHLAPARRGGAVRQAPPREVPVSAPRASSRRVLV